jgi:hypothetical protein
MGDENSEPRWALRGFHLVVVLMLLTTLSPAVLIPEDRYLYHALLTAKLGGDKVDAFCGTSASRCQSFDSSEE